MDTTSLAALSGPHRLRAHLTRLAFAMGLLLLVPACASVHFGTPAGHTEDARVAAMHSVLATRAQRLETRDQHAVAEVLLDAERHHGLDPLLLVALIEHESRWDARAVSSHRALGLMQVKGPVGKPVAEALEIPWSGESTLFDPVSNVRVGIAYFAEMMDRFGVVELALTAYNIGPNRTASIIAVDGDPPQGFARAVLARYERIRAGAPAAVVRTAGL